MKGNNFLSEVINFFKDNSKNSNNSKTSSNLYCGKCGHALKDTDKFCPSCGTKKNSEGEMASLFCPNCGEVFDDTTTICPNCDKLLISIDQDPDYKSFMKEYATTIVLWGYDKPRKLIKNGETPVYYTSECSITNIEIFINDLITNEYLKHPSNQELLQTLTIKELKEVLKKDGESVTGNKNDLISKIINKEINVPIFNRIEEYYIMSAKGLDFFESHKDYVELHRHQKYRITPREFYEIKKQLLVKNSRYSYRDCIWGIFQNRILNYTREKDYLQLYINYENMGDFCYEEGKANVAVTLYLKCVIYELCGVTFYNEWKWFHDDAYANDMLKKSIKESTIYCNGIQSLIKCKKYYNDDMVKIEYDHLEMNFKLCSLELIKKLISEALNDSMFNIEDYKDLIIRDRLNNLNKYL